MDAFFDKKEKKKKAAKKKVKKDVVDQLAVGEDGEETGAFGAVADAPVSLVIQSNDAGEVTVEAKMEHEKDTEGDEPVWKYHDRAATVAQERAEEEKEAAEAAGDVPAVKAPTKYVPGAGKLREEEIKRRKNKAEIAKVEWLTLEEAEAKREEEAKKTPQQKADEAKAAETAAAGGGSKLAWKPGARTAIQSDAFNKKVDEEARLRRERAAEKLAALGDVEPAKPLAASANAWRPGGGARTPSTGNAERKPIDVSTDDKPPAASTGSSDWRSDPRQEITPQPEPERKTGGYQPPTQKAFDAPAADALPKNPNSWAAGKREGGAAVAQKELVVETDAEKAERLKEKLAALAARDEEEQEKTKTTGKFVAAGRRMGSSKDDDDARRKERAELQKKRQDEMEARVKAEEEEKLRRKEEVRLQAEAEAAEKKRREEEEVRRQQQLEEERRRAEEEARLRAEAEARRLEEEAEEKRRREAEAAAEEARLQAEAEEKARAAPKSYVPPSRGGGGVMSGAYVPRSKRPGATSTPQTVETAPIAPAKHHHTPHPTPAPAQPTQPTPEVHAHHHHPQQQQMYYQQHAQQQHAYYPQHQQHQQFHPQYHQHPQHAHPVPHAHPQAAAYPASNLTTSSLTATAAPFVPPSAASSATYRPGSYSQQR